LFTIARRQSINRYRRWRPPMEADDVTLSAAPGPETSEIVAAEDHRRRLWAVAAEVLSEEETTALWLHYVEEMPTRDIATVVGRSRVAVKTMLFRARRRLLPHLEKLDGQSPDRDDDSAAFGQPVPLEVHDV